MRVGQKEKRYNDCDYSFQQNGNLYKHFDKCAELQAKPIDVLFVLISLEKEII